MVNPGGGLGRARSRGEEIISGHAEASEKADILWGFLGKRLHSLQHRSALQRAEPQAAGRPRSRGGGRHRHVRARRCALRVLRVCLQEMKQGRGQAEVEEEAVAEAAEKERVVLLEEV